MAGLCHIANDILVFFVAATTGRIGWCLLTGWLLPILALTISFRKGMQVNGLMVLICFVLFLVCRSGLAELRGWNVKQRKKRPVLFWLLYTVIFLLMFYSVAQAQMQGYILNIQAGTVKRCRCCGWCL